jgi:pilus assembly protein CpaF
MKLVERISSQQPTAQNAPRTNSLIAPSAAKTRQRDVLADGFQQLKLAVHNRLFETLDVSRLESLEASMASTKVTQAITEILNEEGRLLTEVDRARLVEEIKNELLGLGPLEPLLWDEDVNDILVNGPNQVYVERQGKLLSDRCALQR